MKILLTKQDTSPQPFPNETKRIEFLFELYEKYTNPLLSTKKSKKTKI
jgi:hypothetical protein